MSRHISQVIIKYMELMYMLPVIPNVDLFMLPLLHQEGQMLLQHAEKQNGVSDEKLASGEIFGQ